jgi:hypothetical protein
MMQKYKGKGYEDIQRGTEKEKKGGRNTRIGPRKKVCVYAIILQRVDLNVSKTRIEGFNIRFPTYLLKLCDGCLQGVV